MLVGTNRVFIIAFIEELQVFFLANKFLILMLSFVVDNMEKYQTNLDIQSISIRHIYITRMHVLSTNVIMYQLVRKCVV
jgi:hypothetical protein